MMLTDEQFIDVAVKWCEQRGIDPNGMSDVPRINMFGYREAFKTIAESVVDEMRRLEKEDSMRRVLTDYKNDVLFPPSAIGYKAGSYCFAPNLSDGKKSD